MGKCIAANEPLALEPPLSQMPNQDPAHRFSLHHDPKRRAGQVTGVQVIPATDPTRPATVEFALQETARTELGDKLANRHGHKGVIGQILPDGQMPYFLLDAGASAESSCRCGETRPHRHLQVLINPLSVISRMNLGQLRETVEARSPELKGLPDKVPCFEPRLDEPPRRLESEVLVGEQYVLKLDHNAAGKVHARSQEPQYYSAFEQQPLRGRRLLEDGRRLEGGQRLGEMEVWALMAHNAPALLQEMLTVKSDNPRARIALSANLRQSGNPIYRGSNCRKHCEPLPPACWVWVCNCRRPSTMLASNRWSQPTGRPKPSPGYAWNRWISRTLGPGSPTVR
ncbi:MAG: hypothetical protein IPL59_18585 [Candidatus Competibacteraceae bacterium]|nr:hypothetical protein [Candidatus Competibacteraceae bacterium]